MSRPASWRQRAVGDTRRDDDRRPATTPTPTAARPDAAADPTPLHAAVHREHWAPPDPLGDILAVAWRPGAAPPLEIRARSEVYARVLAELPPEERSRPVLGRPVGVPLVLDDQLPGYPGFEVVRIRPGLAAA